MVAFFTRRGLLHLHVEMAKKKKQPTAFTPCNHGDQLASLLYSRRSNPFHKRTPASVTSRNVSPCLGLLRYFRGDCRAAVPPRPASIVHPPCRVEHRENSNAFSEETPLPEANAVALPRRAKGVQRGRHGAVPHSQGGRPTPALFLHLHKGGARCDVESIGAREGGGGKEHRPEADNTPQQDEFASDFAGRAPLTNNSSEREQPDAETNKTTTTTTAETELIKKGTGT